MRSVKAIIILMLALTAGCTLSAGISRGQDLHSDLLPSVIVDNDDFRQVHNASVRVRAYENGSLAWMGSGLVYKIENNRLFCISNEHVCGSADKITAEFFRDGRSLGEFDMRVDLCKQSDDGVDIGVISCNIGNTLKGIEPIPFTKDKVKVDDEVFFVGSARGEWPKGKIGRVLQVTDMHFYSNPTSIPGDSGSGMIRFNDEGEPEIVGLIAWYAMMDGNRVCMSMHSQVVLDVLAGGEVPDHGDVPPTAEDTERLIQSLMERLREMREDNRRERKGLLDRLSAMQLENAMVQEEARRFRDLFKKQQEGQIEKQAEQDSVVERLSSKFDNLKTLLKWSFYAFIGLLFAALFLKQGWALTAIVAIVTFAFRTGKLAYLLIHNAIVSKSKNPETVNEALETLQDKIEIERRRNGL